MSGFDIRNGSGVVAVARQGGIDVVLDDESKYETPAVRYLDANQLFLGSVGTASNIMNPIHTISQIKRLIGRKSADPEMQRDLNELPYLVSEGPDGYPLIDVPDLEGVWSPAQILRKAFSDLKSVAKRHHDADVVDCCVGIPVYFSDHQRKVVMDAATNAGLHPLRLMHETTAAALAYGIYKTDLPENDQLNVAFVDIGHASMQVCIASFEKGVLKILAHSFDQSLGGRDFDEVLFQYFAATFKEEYKIDVFQNATACLRLRAACEELKKVLSTKAEAPLNIECLMKGKDVKGFIQREKFEQLSDSLLSRVTEPLWKALLDAGLPVKDIHVVEVVGLGSCVPAVTRRLKEFFGKEPSRTMNAIECVAKGCALQCAILRPTFKVRNFQVNDIFPFPIAWSWKGSAPESQNGADNVFNKGNPIPCLKDLTFSKSGTFSIDFHYADMSEYRGQPKISTYMIGPFQSTKGERAKLKLKVCLSQDGIVSVKSATLLEEDVEVAFVEEPAKEATKMEIDEVPADATPPCIMENDVSTRASNVLVAENGVLETGDMPVQIRTDVEVMNSPWRAVSSLEDAQLVVGLKATGLKIRAAMNPCLSDEKREEVSTLLRSEGIVFQNKSISQVIRIASISQLNLVVSDSNTNTFIEIEPSVDDDMYDTIDGESFAKGFNILGGRHGSVKSRQLHGPTCLPKYCLALFALVGVGVCVNCLVQKIKITIPEGFIQIQNHMSWRPKTDSCNLDKTVGSCGVHHFSKVFD